MRDCGASIVFFADAPDSRAPCHRCGGSKRASYGSITDSVPSNYMLDNYVAHKLTECGARELPTDGKWINTFILTSVFNVNLQAKMRAYVFNFLRRAEGALSAYHWARIALIEYLETPRNVLSPYFRALLNFKVRISQCYQGYELLARASGEKPFQQDNNSEAERLYVLYVDSKHMDRMIDGGKMPTEATAAIWITNQGLESSRATLSSRNSSKCCSGCVVLPNGSQRFAGMGNQVSPVKGRRHASKGNEYHGENPNMTWVIGAPCMFGYGVAISDIRVTLPNGMAIDCLQKICPVGECVTSGFAGSVRFGLAAILDLQKNHAHPDPECQTS